MTGPEDPARGRDRSSPLVTVIVPVFNHAAFVTSCLDSVRALRYPRIELIVIDDASSDDSVARVNAWLEENARSTPARFIVHASNQGIAKTLNEGIRLAVGDFVCLIASDDMLLPDGVAARVRYLEEHPEKFAVFADMEIVDESGGLLHPSAIAYSHRTGLRKALLKEDERIAPTLFFHWGALAPTALYRAEAFRELGPYDESLSIEDWEMFLRIAVAGRMGFLDDLVARYRLHGRNSIRQRAVAVRNDVVTIAERYSPHFGRLGGLRVGVFHLQARAERATGPARVLRKFLWLASAVAAGVLFRASSRLAIARLRLSRGARGSPLA